MGQIGGTYPEANSVLGPYIDGNGNLYTITEESPATPAPLLRKSTDSGATWEIVDQANGPGWSTWGDLESVWIVQQGTRLYIYSQRGSRIEYWEFNTSDAASNPDKWVTGSFLAITTGITTTSPHDQCVCAVHRANGDQYVFYRTSAQNGGADQAIGYKKKPSAGSWSSETIITVTGKDLTQTITCNSIVEGTDPIPLFIVQGVFSGTSYLAAEKILYYTLNSSDVLSGSVDLTTDVYSVTSPRLDYPMFPPSLRWKSGSTIYDYVTWWAADGKAKGKLITDNTIGSVEEVSDNTIWTSSVITGSPYTGSYGPVGCPVLDPINGKIHFLYADNSTHDVWRATRSNGSWGTDVEDIDAVEAQYLSAKIISVDSDRVIAIVWDLGNGVEDGGIPTSTNIVLPPDVELQQLRPDGDLTTTGWATEPLYSKINDELDSTVITATAS